MKYNEKIMQTERVPRTIPNTKTQGWTTSGGGPGLTQQLQNTWRVETLLLPSSTEATRTLTPGLCKVGTKKIIGRFIYLFI